MKLYTGNYNFRHLADTLLRAGYRAHISSWVWGYVPQYVSHVRYVAGFLEETP